MPKRNNRKRNKHKSPNKKSNPNNNNTSNNSTPLRSPKNNSNDPAERLKQQGNDHFFHKRYTKAVEFYSKSLDIDSSNHTVYSNRSAAYLELKKYDSAIKDAELCIKLMPKWDRGYERKGQVLIAQKKYKEASEFLKESLEYVENVQNLNKLILEIDDLKLRTLDPSEKVIGGQHEQTDKFRTLRDWLLENGAKFPKLYLKYYNPEFRAIHALERINKDEDICYIPHKCIMTSDVAKASIIGRKMIESKVELRSKHSYLAAYLLQEREKGEESSWYKYISILPRKFDTVPIFFEEDRLKLLKGSISLRKIDDRIESLRLEYTNICNAVPEFSRFPHKDFVWARLVVITRIFGLVIDEVKTDGLVPWADMLNHKRPRETKWTYDQKRKGFVITSLQAIKKEAEIFDSYGRKCNSRFFVNYGFSLEHNLDNEAMMSFELSKNDQQYNIKARQLGFNPNDDVKRDFQIPKNYKEKKVKECFSWLRIVHAQGNEFLVISNDSLKIDDIPVLSIRNELSVLTSIAVAAKKALSNFPDTLEYDNELLKNEKDYPRFSNPRNIILMRRGEKEVLTFYINLLKECRELLKLKPKELKTTLRKDKKWKNNDSPLVQYVLGVVVPLVSSYR